MEKLNQNGLQRVHVCPVDTCFELISGKWKPLILWKVRRDGVVRFGELKRQMPTITPKMLTQQLRELEDDGLLARKVYAQVPPKVEYTFTEFGKSLIPVLDKIAEWGTGHQVEIVEILSQQKLSKEIVSLA